MKSISPRYGFLQKLYSSTRNQLISSPALPSPLPSLFFSSLYISPSSLRNQKIFNIALNGTVTVTVSQITALIPVVSEVARSDCLFVSFILFSFIFFIFSPLFFDKVKVADPLPRFSLDEPQPEPASPPSKPSYLSNSKSPTLSHKASTLPHSKSPTPSHKSPTLPHSVPHPHTTPNPTRKSEKNPSPQKRRAETSKDKRSPNPTRNNHSPVYLNFFFVFFVLLFCCFVLLVLYFVFCILLFSFLIFFDNVVKRHQWKPRIRQRQQIPNQRNRLMVCSPFLPSPPFACLILITIDDLQTSKWCDNDKEVVAVVFCQACKMKLCDSCDKLLHSNPHKKSHFRKPFKASTKSIHLPLSSPPSLFLPLSLLPSLPPPSPSPPPPPPPPLYLF